MDQTKDFLEGEGSFFRNQATTIKDSLSPEQYQKFCDLKTDLERIKFIYALEIVHNFDIPVGPFAKSLEKAAGLKNQGNVAFSKENYVVAMNLYGFGLIQCPKTDETLLSTLYANRSAALYYLKEHKLSLQDIEQCLALSYPENLSYKVLDRKARCLLALNDLPPALDTFKSALKSLETAKLDTNARLKKEHDFSLMIAMLTKTLSDKTPPKKNTGSQLLLPAIPKINSTNKLIPTATDLVKIEQNPSEGRYAVANKDIGPGDLLIVEKAHCCNLLFDFSKTHCQHCFIRVLYYLPCPDCANVVFCSTKCRDEALGTYHRYECSFLGCLWKCGSSIICNLAVRLLTQKGLTYFLNIRDALKGKLPEKYNPDDYRTRSVMSVVLLKFLKTANYFSGENNQLTDQITDTQAYIGSLILHNLQFLQFNAHEIAELQYSVDFPGDLDRAKSQFIGGGLFPTLALFNHSCEPGIVRYFSGSKVIVRAVKSIQTGEIIAENYGPIYTQLPRNERRAELKSRYWFDCNCIPCTQNWPVFDQMQTDILPFRCIKSKTCPGVAKVGLNTEEFMFPCPECKEMICIFGGLKGLNDTEAMFKKGENFMNNQMFQDALNVFIKIMKLLDNTLRPPYKDFCLCQQKIRSAMLTFGNVYYPKKSVT